MCSNGSSETSVWSDVRMRSFSATITGPPFNNLVSICIPTASQPSPTMLLFGIDSSMHCLHGPIFSWANGRELMDAEAN